MRFLIVDDEPMCGELLVETLRAYGHCDVASDGAEGIDAFRRALDGGTPYEAVFLDIMMPGIDGHEVLREIRRIESQRGTGTEDGVRVVMTSALAESEQWLQAFDEGCQSYVTKPFSADELIGQLRHLGVLAETSS